MALVLSSLESPAAVSDWGGDVIRLRGTFEHLPISVVVVGADEVPCYSGQSGFGNAGYRVDGTTLDVVVPPLDPGTYDLTARDGVDEDTLVGALVVQPRSWPSTMFGLRRLWPPIFAVGKRLLEEEPPLV